MNQTNNLHKEKITFDVAKANLYALFMIIPITLIFALPYYLIWQNFRYDSVDLILVLIIIIAGTILHELIHAITWAIFAKTGLRAIKFGIRWKLLNPYCHCKDLLLVKHYRLGTILPGILIGICPAVLSIIIGNPVILIIGIVFTMAAGGDFIMIYLLRNQDKNTLVYDHPTEAGCYIFHKKDSK